MEGWGATLSDFWTMERVDKLFELAKEGFTFSQIGAAIGCSRNAAIGKYNRIRVSRGVHVPTPRKIMLPRIAAPKKVIQAKPKVVPKPMPEVAPKAALVLRPVDASPPPGPRVGIVDVIGCRFPVADDAGIIGGIVLCNEPPDGEWIYCAHHASIAYRKAVSGTKHRKYKTIPTSLIRMAR